MVVLCSSRARENHRKARLTRIALLLSVLQCDHQRTLFGSVVSR